LVDAPGPPSLADSHAHYPAAGGAATDLGFRLTATFTAGTADGGRAGGFAAARRPYVEHYVLAMTGAVKE